MAWCLSPEAVRRFKQALKDREIDPVKLGGMESVARRELLAKFVGEENAVQVNSLYESKLLLKNQKAGYISWAKRVAGLTPQVKNDMLTKIERLDKVLSPEEEKSFLEDLASSRLRINVRSDEAKQIYDLSQKVRETKADAKEDGTFPSEEKRLAHGMAKVLLEDYVNSLKIKSERLSFRETPIKKIGELAANVPGIMKSLVASMDNSFWGRQGIKTLLDVRTSGIWFKNFLKSWRDIGKQLVAKGKFWTAGDNAVMDSIKADIYSRPNAMTGKYLAGDYGLHVFSEEAYPSAVPELIPVLGRLFKASEVAYNGGALRLRADIADRLIKRAEKAGVNTLDRTEARGLGQLVSSMTGRGSNILGLTGQQQGGANVLLFSIKFLQSNIDTLTAHRSDRRATEFSKKEAAKNLLSIVTSVSLILFLSKLFDPDAVDEDPRSTNFGKVKVFGHWVDVTGGMASLVTLSSRIVPTQRNGVWGFWRKSSTGNWVKSEPGFGNITALDTLESFLEGKLSPAAGLIRDILQGENFDGEPVTLKNALEGMIPLSIQNFEKLKEDPASSFVFGSIILEGLGLSTSTYRYKANWGTSTSKEMAQFKEKVGEDRFLQANDDFNRSYSEWFNRASVTDEYKKLSDDAKAKLISKAKQDIKEEIFKEYGFKYKQDSQKNREEERAIENLLP